MFCPRCEIEYREGFTTCADCGTPLVATLAADPEVHPEGDLEKVFETSDASLVPVVHSVLEAAGIEVMTKNEPVQDFFALGRLMGGGVVGPVAFYVLPQDAAPAREALAQVESTPAPPEEEAPE
jgi:hypothetical protein